MKKSIINYCKTHSEDPLSEYVLKGFEESTIKKKAELKGLKLIATALEQITEGRSLK